MDNTERSKHIYCDNTYVRTCNDYGNRLSVYCDNKLDTDKGVQYRQVVQVVSNNHVILD